MPLINCKFEWKLKWTAAAGNDSNGNPNNNNFTIKYTKLYVPTVTLSEKDNQKLSKLPSKGFERSIYCNEYKVKSENKDTTNLDINTFSNQVLLELIDYLF